MKTNSKTNTTTLKSNDTIVAVNDASSLFGKLVSKEFEKIGMRSSYRHVMSPLMENESMTQLEIVRVTNLKAPTISITLRNMERQGIVRREKNDADRRETHVYITEKGRKLHAKVIEAIERAQQVMLKDLSPKELKAAKSVLDKMSANLREELGD